MGLLERQLRLILCPIDHLEQHAAPEHLAFEITGMLSPCRRLANAKTRLIALSFLRVVRGKRAADTLVHQGETVVGEGGVIHRTPKWRPPRLRTYEMIPWPLWLPGEWNNNPHER